MSHRGIAQVDFPFGRPFASEMSGDEVRDGFCAMPNMQFSTRSGPLAFTSRRGGGKTHVLRKMFYDRKASGVARCEYEPMSLSTEYALPELRSYDDARLSKHLKIVWETVLALRVARVVSEGVRRSNLDRAQRKVFLEGLQERLKLAGIPLERLNRTASIFHEVLPRLSHQYQGRRWLLDRFNRREFIQYLKKVDITAYLFLDDADDEYPDSPSFWNVNLASFYSAISFLRRELPKIHIVTAMRREVYDHMQHADPSWTRIAGPDNVKDIVWDAHSLRFLFEMKIQGFPSELIPFGNKSHRWITRFLGLKEIVATSSPCPAEPVFGYILRHTFYRARDLVYMGNSLWHHLQEVKTRNDPEELAERIRAGVRHAAGMIAREVTSECDAVLRDLAPCDLDRLPPTTYLLTRLRKNIVTREQLGRALEEVKQRTPNLASLNPYDVLGYWGLIGWVRRDRAPRIQKFNFEATANAPRIRVLPKSDVYFIHPAVYDLDDVLGGIEIVHNYTVGHGYPVPPTSALRIRRTAFAAESPYRLDWQEPRIVDAKRHNIPITAEQHLLLKALFTTQSIRLVSYKSLGALLQRHHFGKATNPANADFKREIEQLLRGIRRLGRRLGIVNPNALVRTVHGKGVEQGNEWHKKQPCIGRSNVPEAPWDHEPAAKEKDDDDLSPD